jgi:hypothetical protein
MPEEPNAPLVFVTAASADEPRDGSFVVIVRTREEFVRWLPAPVPGVEWLQVEGLLGDPDAWAIAAQGATNLPLDVVLSHPAEEFSQLYRLADVRIVRDVRVTMPVSPGFMKALRLAASLQLPVRLLPGQPSISELGELTEAVDFYLHDPAVDAPIEFFHSLLAALHASTSATLWDILEQDPAIFARLDDDGHARAPSDFVATHLRGLLERHAECEACRWQGVCAGFFKLPDPAYSCEGVKHLLARLDTAAKEIERDLAASEPLIP